LPDAPNVVLTRVLAASDAYFSINPYWRWFRPLETLLQAGGASYADGSACHLDLAQWATSPAWGKVGRDAHSALVADGRDFLKWQLEEHNIAYVFLNGRTVVDRFGSELGLPLAEVGTIPGPQGKPVTLFAARPPVGPLGIFGWSVNLQSSFGVTTACKTALANAAAGYFRS
jgi:hypothetical protein